MFNLILAYHSSDPLILTIFNDIRDRALRVFILN